MHIFRLVHFQKVRKIPNKEGAHILKLKEKRQLGTNIESQFYLYEN